MMLGNNTKILEMLVDKLLEYEFEREDKNKQIENDFKPQILPNYSEYLEWLKHLNNEETKLDDGSQNSVQFNLLPPNFPFDNAKVLYEEIKTELNNSSIFDSEMDIEKYFKGKQIFEIIYR